MEKLFERWNSSDGLKVLRQLAQRKSAAPSMFRDFDLPRWERAMLRRALRAPEGFASHRLTPQRRIWLTRSLAQKLDMLRDIAKHRKAADRERDQEKFRGNRGHLAALLAAAGSPTAENDWNAWRARHPRIVPDLRGADLSGLNLQDIRLDRAQLSGAALDGATFRTGTLRHANLRGCSMFHCDCSYTDLTGARLDDAHMEQTYFLEANMRGASLRRASLIGSNFNRADLRGTDLRETLVWGTSVWNVTRDEATKQTGIRTGGGFFDPADPGNWPADRDRPYYGPRVDDIALAAFISLVEQNRASIASLLDAASDKLVLLLGRFRGRQADVLIALERAIGDLDYLPIVFRFEGPKDRDVIETVAMLAGMSKFVIADLTSPRSTPLESHLIIPDMAVPFVPIVRAGERPFSMFSALQRKYAWVLPTVEYKTDQHLIRQFKNKIVTPAVALARRLRRMKHS